MDCALCKTPDATPMAVAPRPDEVAVCAECRRGIETGPTDGPHWQCLNEAIWSQNPGEQVLAWRLLTGLDAAWANAVLDMAYLEPDVMEWAQAETSAGGEIVHRDSNGAILQAGDTVTLIKDLPVKGAGFTAKQGTAVRKISLEADNAEHIAGRVEGQRIVILTKFVKKA